MKIAVIQFPGSNCDLDTVYVLRHVINVDAELVWHREFKADAYDAVVLPGGFSYGDALRAGVIAAYSPAMKHVKEMAREGKPVLGICNGFQVLVESGLLPGFSGVSQYPEAALATNIPIGYRCRWVYLKHENSGKCIFTKEVPRGRVLRIPIAHAEGRFIFPKEKEKKFLERLLENDQLVFRYCDDLGKPADGKYPWNPNGSFYDIAGICDPSGTIFGLMPHPERAFYGWKINLLIYDRVYHPKILAYIVIMQQQSSFCSIRNPQRLL